MASFIKRWPIWLCAIVAIVAWLGVREYARKSKKPAPSRYQMLDSVSAERRVLSAFVRELRAALEWNLAQPPAADEAARAVHLSKLVEKFATIKTAGLPEDLADAWKKALVQWRKLEGRPHAPPAEGKEVMARLNAALVAHGYPDVRL